MARESGKERTRARHYENKPWKKWNGRGKEGKKLKFIADGARSTLSRVYLTTTIAPGTIISSFRLS
jgi:hypothetical protein